MLSAPELISLAASRGLSLAHFLPAERSPKRLGHEFDGVEWVPLRGSERPRPPRVVHGAAERAPLPWLAVRYSLAGDHRAFWPLWWGLLHHGQRLGKAGRWNAEVTAVDGRRRVYLEPLARLVLDEERHPALFAAAPVQLRAACLNVSEKTWAAQLAGRYRELARVYFRWRSAGLEQVRAAILGGCFV